MRHLTNKLNMGQLLNKLKHVDDSEEEKLLSFHSHMEELRIRDEVRFAEAENRAMLELQNQAKSGKKSK
jgi:hypothetical protein